LAIQLVSLSNVKAFLEVSGTEFDALLNILIGYVSDRIQTFLNRGLQKVERTEYFEAGRRKYYLQGYPVDSTVTITVTLDDNAQTVDSDYFLWGDEGLIELYVKSLYIEPKQLSVTYTGGYNASETVIGNKTTYCLTVPDAIEYATMLQIAFVFKRRRDIGLSSTSMPDGSIATFYSGDLLPEVKNILRMYRKAPCER
jgi:hypothetical protein